MLASRLVKSCLFVLVALAPVVAKAGFVIDSFNGFGNMTTLPGGLTATRSGTLGGGSLALTGNSAIISVNAFSSMVFDYTFSNTLSAANTGDALGGNPALRLDFHSASGNLTVGAQRNIAAPTINLGDTNSVVGAFSLSGSVNILTSNSIRLIFANNTGSNASVVLSQVTATPEPTTLLMFSAVAGVGYVARRRMTAKKA